MKINSRLEIDDINTVLAKRSMQERGKVQRYIDSECIRLMAPYTPKMDGTLIDSATKLTDIGSGYIEQGGGALAPYGRKWYYKEANFTGAPMRGTRWFERMKNDGGRESILRGVKRMVGIK